MPKTDTKRIPDEELGRLVEQDFIKLRDEIYKLLPADCPLKFGDGLALCMVGLINLFFWTNIFTPETMYACNAILNRARGMIKFRIDG